MIAESTIDTPGLRHRILCAFLYMGVAPAAFVLRYHHKSDFTSHHTKHALASSFITHVVLLVFVVFRVPLIVLGIYRDDIYYAYFTRINIVTLILLIVTFSGLLILAGISVYCAIRGKSAKVPLLRRVSKKTWLPALMVPIFAVSLAFVLLMTSLSCYSVSITPEANNEATVYMLYDDAGVFPRWIFTLGFLPITRRASETLGPDSVCVCKLTREAFIQAFSSGKFIFLATHGAGPGRIYADRLTYGAPFASQASGGNRPHFIYLTACSLGKDDDSWNKEFPETEVVSFDRWSATVEHIWWLYAEGPDKLESVFP
ncbi:MAG: hypothetical protein AMJ65_18515 [Phycisphaerae bacterium SG8_4]|nr:MAG: hypothetical protein AMJ65_18515 [Phycisphaerae bacterium SG8_4]